MRRISYAVPVCNEHEELNRLLTLLINNIDLSCDEIVVQCDQGNTTGEVYEVLNTYRPLVKVLEFPLKGNFAAFKNNLKDLCNGAWVFQIDADELLHPEFLKILPQILVDNPSVDLFCLPRINTVAGLTDSHIQKWGWRVNEKGWINFPDVQTRIIQNSPKIQWVNKVHEVIVGHRSHAVLPLEELYSILHYKDILRQERQNTLYNLL